MQYTEEFKRLRSHYTQLREKSLHFKTADDRIYREVWRNSEQEARQLIALTLEADRCIHEQQLCLPYKAPSTTEILGGIPSEETIDAGVDCLSEAATTTFRSGSSEKDNSSFQKSGHAPSSLGGSRWLLNSSSFNPLNPRSKEGSDRSGGIATGVVGGVG
ncbi:nbp2b, partial [Cystoisospora suis]